MWILDYSPRCVIIYFVPLADLAIEDCTTQFAFLSGLIMNAQCYKSTRADEPLPFLISSTRIDPFSESRFKSPTMPLSTCPLWVANGPHDVDDDFCPELALPLQP